MCTTRQTAVLTCLLFLAACTPSHTAQQTETYARELGLSDNYEIRRWHNRRIPADSRILVAVSAHTEVDSARLSAAIAEALSPSFTVAHALPAMTPPAAARARAMKDQYQFLMEVTRVEWQPADPAPDTPADMPADTTEETPAQGQTQTQQPEADRADRIRIEVVLLDVVSGKAVDKFLITAKPSFFRTSGATVEELLTKAIGRLAGDLAGS